MSVRIDMSYEGNLCCDAVHEPSGERISTEAPRDNQGTGGAFSPTDLVGAALGTCILTVMGVAARKRKLDISGARAVVLKEMSSVPRRHISEIDIRISLPATLDEKARVILERTAHTCPVHASLGEMTEVKIVFDYI